MQIFIVISMCFSMFMSIEASFKDHLSSHFTAKDIINIEKCIDALTLFMNAFNSKQESLLLSSIDRNQTKLRNDVVHMITTRNMQYAFSLYSIDNCGIEIMPHAIKINGYYKFQEVDANGRWSREGFSNYFVLQESSNGNWVIIDTNFSTKLDWDNFYGFVGLLWFLFALWMLIDCFNREFEKRGRWFCAMIFIPFLGALLYFFCVKLKQWDNQPKYYENYLQNDEYSKQTALAIRSNWIYLWTFSLLAMLGFTFIPYAVCTSMMIALKVSIIVLLYTLSVMYIFSFAFAYLRQSTIAIKLSILGLVFMICFRVCKYISNILLNFESLSYEKFMNETGVFLVTVLWLICLCIESYRLYCLNQAVLDKKNVQA